MPTVYLDNNATTAVAPEVVAEMLPFLTQYYGNASSSHDVGTIVAERVREARRHVQALVGAQFDHEIVFTSGGTESDNTAILSALRTQTGRDEIIISAVEHPAILAVCEDLETSGRAVIRKIGVDGLGRIDRDAYRAALGAKTALVSVMWANNETGTLFPVAELAREAKAAGALFHTDAVQAAGKVAIALAGTDIDMASLSGHKLHGPKGIGALYVKKGTPFQSLLKGGKQERGRRGGTENVPGIIGLGAAAQLAVIHLSDEQGRVGALRDRLEAAILSIHPDCVVNGDRDARLPNTLNIAFPDLEGEALQTHLNRADIAVSLGSACASGSMEPSHVLLAMAIARNVISGALRFSLSRFNGAADIERVVEVLPLIIDKLR